MILASCLPNDTGSIEVFQVRYESSVTVSSISILNCAMEFIITKVIISKDVFVYNATFDKKKGHK